MGNNIGVMGCMRSSRDSSLDTSVVSSNLESSSDKAHCITIKDKTYYCYAASKKGRCNETKPNQDRLLLHVDKDTNSIIAGVFDGHGEEGHSVAEFVRDFFIDNLVHNKLFESDPLSAMHLSLKLTEEALVTKNAILCEQSGTTVLIGVIRDNHLYALNVGDSRMFYCYESDDKLITEPITHIHCPDHDAERNRIEESGGRVLSMRSILSESSTPRICFVSETGELDGGLAMSRSIGDISYHKVGVISEPDLYDRDLGENSVALLIGSDGLTTNFGMSYCFNTVLREKDHYDGFQTLIFECYTSMFDESHGEYVDDISGVYIQMKDMDQTKPLQFVMASGKQKS